MRITKRSVEATTPHPNKDLFRWDDQLKGFGIRIKPSGRCTYIIQYRNAAGRSRRLTVGRHGTLTADQARATARQMLADASQGGDPLEERERPRKGPSVAQLLESYWERHAELNMKPNTLRRFRNVIRRHILPILGSRSIHDITRKDIIALHLEIGQKTETTANIAVAILHKAYNLAIDWGWYDESQTPATGSNDSRPARWSAI